MSLEALKYFLSRQFSFLRCLVKVCLCTFHELSQLLLPRYKDIFEETVLITGGGHGIGRRLALQFATRRPKHIVLWGRNEKWLIKTQRDVAETGVQCSYNICDVSSREQIYSTAEAVRRTVGDITILVNNAGAVHGEQVVNISEEEFEHSLKVNTLAHIWTIKAFLPAMISTNHGHIVCMSSTLGLMGLSGTADYTTAKFSLSGLMESLVWELEEYSGIKTTTVYPYQVDNDMFAGCRVRFPRLFPQLTEETVAKKSLAAILTDRKQIVLPWYFNTFVIMKSILPVSCLYPSLKFLGLHNMMEPLGTRKHL